MKKYLLMLIMIGVLLLSIFMDGQMKIRAASSVKIGYLYYTYSKEHPYFQYFDKPMLLKLKDFIDRINNMDIFDPELELELVEGASSQTLIDQNVEVILSTMWLKNLPGAWDVTKGGLSIPLPGGFKVVSLADPPSRLYVTYKSTTGFNFCKFMRQGIWAQVALSDCSIIWNSDLSLKGTRKTFKLEGNWDIRDITKEGPEKITIKVNGQTVRDTMEFESSWSFTYNLKSYPWGKLRVEVKVSRGSTEARVVEWKGIDKQAPSIELKELTGNGFVSCNPYEHPPSFIFQDPGPGKSLGLIIKGNCSDSESGVKFIEVALTQAGELKQAALSADGAWNAQLEIAGGVPGIRRIYVQATDNSENKSELICLAQVQLVVIDKQAPSIELKEITGNGFVSCNPSEHPPKFIFQDPGQGKSLELTIKGNCSDSESGVQSVGVALNQEIIPAGLSPDGTWTAQKAIAGGDPGIHWIYVQAVDKAGNKSELNCLAQVQVIDNQAPSIELKAITGNGFEHCNPYENPPMYYFQGPGQGNSLVLTIKVNCSDSVSGVQSVGVTTCQGEQLIPAGLSPDGAWNAQIEIAGGFLVHRFIYVEAVDKAGNKSELICLAQVEVLPPKSGG